MQRYQIVRVDLWKYNDRNKKIRLNYIILHVCEIYVTLLYLII